MRDIINLIESVGLARRQPGARFVNAQGDELFFVGLYFYPDSGSFANDDELNQTIAQAAAANGIQTNNIVWSNSERGAGGFGLARFADAGGQDLLIGRYFKRINPNRQENYFPNELPGGYQLQTGASQKERAGYKPSEVLQSLDNLTPDDIFTQVQQRFGADSAEAVAMQTFMQANSFPIMIDQGDMNFAAFTNYFCELLQPMALVLGKPTKGNASEAESRFLDQGGFDTCTISFGGGATQGLVDSVLKNAAGQTLGISTKAKSGAKASVKNLLDKLQELQGQPEGQELLDKYQTEVGILEIISDGGFVDGPLNLAVMFDIISSQDKQQVKDLRNQTGNKESIVDSLSPRLKKLYQSREATDPEAVIPFYHLLAAVATKVAKHINDSTNFGKAAGAILNYGAFVQMYTQARPRGKTIALDQFTVVYPSEAVTDVLIRADKTYYSTGNKGNFTFKILKNGATDSDTEIEDHEQDVKPDIDLDRITAQRSGVRVRPTKADDESALGRRRRR